MAGPESFADARSAMLGRIRAAVRGAEIPQLPAAYDRRGEREPGSPEVLELLVDRLRDYRAEVRVVGAEGLPAALAEALREETAPAGGPGPGAPGGPVLLPPGLPGDVVRGVGALGLPLLEDDGALPLTAIDQARGVVTTAAVAIAVTGTIVLAAGPGQGRRLLSLVPDLHVVVLRAAQVVESVPEGLARLDPVAPLTFVSGPSATSDIELVRVEGVHGPRTLRVIVTP